MTSCSLATFLLRYFFEMFCDGWPWRLCTLHPFATAERAREIVREIERVTLVNQGGGREGGCTGLYYGLLTKAYLGL